MYADIWLAGAWVITVWMFAAYVHKPMPSKNTPGMDGFYMLVASAAWPLLLLIALGLRVRKFLLRKRGIEA